jgi:large conductance mechanosensitive channel
MFKEFKTFIAKGDMVEIAVGLIIATAFTSVVGALTKDLINPIIGLAGKADFSNWFFVLKEGTTPGPYATVADADKVSAVVLKYGDFLSILINFLITAFVVFLLVKAFNRFKAKPQPAPAPEPVKNSKEEELLTEIRDLLQAAAK